MRDLLVSVYWHLFALVCVLAAIATVVLFPLFGEPRGRGIMAMAIGGMIIPMIMSVALMTLTYALYVADRTHIRLVVLFVATANVVGVICLLWISTF